MINPYQDRIRPLIDAKRKEGVSYSQMEVDMGLPAHSINKWNSGTNQSYTKKYDVLSSYFGVSIGFLLGETDDPAPRRPDYAAPTISEDSVTFHPIGDVAAGYNGIAFEDLSEDNIEVPRSYLHGRKLEDFFVLRVKGDSMYPDYQDGDHVLVLRQSTMDRSGQVGVVIYGDENATLKRVEYVMGEDWMTLRPINPQFPPITIVDEELEHCVVLGVAKMVIREIGRL